ncbi:MAG: hypothetical protein FJX75_27835 [Armatimonadetes bacterium]|nr:hypothetical protein [Armatimonadota bacterium]
MDPKLPSYVNAANRGVEWLLSQQNADGSFIREDLQADCYHKAIAACALTGHPIAANRLLNWIKANDLQPDGRLRHFDAGLALYKTAWVCQGAHRLGRLDISRPVLGYILRCQAPCGGFYQLVEGNPYVEPVCTSWAAVAAIHGGAIEAAERAAECMIAMVDQQPDPSRFYFWMSPEGQLATEESPVAGAAPSVDATKTQQAYYCPGIACLFLAKLHMATGNAAYLEGAQRLFEISLGFAEDRYSYPTAGKSAVGAATLYLLTGDERAKAAACEFADYLLEQQNPEGWWANPHNQELLTRLDHTAEFIIWLSEIAGALAG